MYSLCRSVFGCFVVYVSFALARAHCNTDIGLRGPVKTRAGDKSPLFIVLSHDRRSSLDLEGAGPEIKRSHVGPLAALSRRRAWALRRMLLFTITAVVVVAAAFLVLRCAWALGVKQRSEGRGRSLAGIEGGEFFGACGNAFSDRGTGSVLMRGKFSTAASLEQSGYRLLEKARKILEIWEGALQPLNDGDRLKWTLYLETLIFLEIGALCGITQGTLQAKTREVAAKAIRTVRQVLRKIQPTRRMAGRRCTTKHMLDGLVAVMSYEPAECAITPAQREKKLRELLQLQHVAIDMVLGILNHTESAEVPLNAKRLAFISGVRKRQLFGDEALNKPLVECQSLMKHYRVVKEGRIPTLRQEVSVMSLEMKLKQLNAAFADAEKALEREIENRNLILNGEFNLLESCGSSGSVSTCLSSELATVVSLSTSQASATHLESGHDNQVLGGQSFPPLPQGAPASSLGPAPAPPTPTPCAVPYPSSVSSGRQPSLAKALPSLSSFSQLRHPSVQIHTPVSAAYPPMQARTPVLAAYPPFAPPGTLPVPSFPSVPGVIRGVLPASHFLQRLLSGSSSFPLQATEASPSPLVLPVAPSDIHLHEKSDPSASQALAPSDPDAAGAAPSMQKFLPANAFSLLPQKLSKAPGAHRKEGPKFEGFAEGMPPPDSPPGHSISARENHKDLYDSRDSTN